MHCHIICIVYVSSSVLFRSIVRYMCFIANNTGRLSTGDDDFLSYKHGVKSITIVLKGPHLSNHMYFDINTR